jgi:peptide/nickel transport system ATP-binding protein
VAEYGPVQQVYDNPQHPYTKALLSAQPSMDPDRRRKEAPISGDPPNPINPPSGCRFHTRCPMAQDLCTHTAPALASPGNPEHSAACHLVTGAIRAKVAA